MAGYAQGGLAARPPRAVRAIKINRPQLDSNVFFLYGRG
jgi:hypothetical protein